MQSCKLLAIDDEPLILECYRHAFADQPVEILTARSATEGLAAFSQCRPDVLVTDVQLPDMNGLRLFQRIKESDAKVPVIVVTGHGTASTAIEAMRLGAFDYLVKPIDPDQLIELVHRAANVSRLMRVPARVADDHDGDDTDADTLVGRCPAMQEVYKSIGRMAQQEVIVLILGESGTGKELVARALYHYSRRAQGPFLAVNCAAIPETLLENELFGHEKGAFTGADRQRFGKFEQCNGGTLFLDEIGDLSPLTQAKILRVLQDQQFERVGGNQLVRTDVRIIAATNRKLQAMVAAGQFRADLFYRLNVCQIDLPPLRERDGDIAILAKHFTRKYGRLSGKEVQEVPPESISLLQHYDWPGNVRELQSILRQTVLHSTGPVLLPEFLKKTAPGGSKPEFPSANSSSTAAPELLAFIRQRLQAGAINLYDEFTRQTDALLLREVLDFTKGNLTQTAKVLGISRGTLRLKLAALGLVSE